MGVIVDLVTLIKQESQTSGSNVDFFAFATIFPLSAWLIILAIMVALGLIFYFSATFRLVKCFHNRFKPCN